MPSRPRRDQSVHFVLVTVVQACYDEPRTSKSSGTSLNVESAIEWMPRASVRRATKDRSKQIPGWRASHARRQLCCGATLAFLGQHVRFLRVAQKKIQIKSIIVSTDMRKMREKCDEYEERRSNGNTVLVVMRILFPSAKMISVMLSQIRRSHKMQN